MKDAAKIVDIKPGYKLSDIRLNLTGVSTFTKGYKAKQNILYKDIVLDVLRTSINHLTKIETEYNSMMIKRLIIDSSLLKMELQALHQLQLKI